MARTYKRDKNGRFAGGGGGGGGGGKPAARGISRGTNRLTRDNSGKITGVGGSGATARGGRLATAKGNKRATQTAKIASGRASGTVGKPKGLQPQSSRSLRTGVAVNRLRATNAKMGNRPDIAEQNIRGRFSGQAGKRLEAGIDRAVKQTKAAEQARLMKPRAQVKAERAAAAQVKRDAAAAKPKRTKSPESQRVSRAKQTEKRRGMNISNPAAWRQESAGRMAANAARTQERALAFYKTGAAKPAAKSAAKPEAAKPAGLRFAKQSSNRMTAELSGGNRINIAQQGPGSFRATLVGKSGSPKMERTGFRNVTEAKKWAANPNARGPRLMGGGLKTEASPKATWRRAAKVANTLRVKNASKKKR